MDNFLSKFLAWYGLVCLTALVVAFFVVLFYGSPMISSVVGFALGVLATQANKIFYWDLKDAVEYVNENKFLYNFGVITLAITAIALFISLYFVNPLAFAIFLSVFLLIVTAAALGEDSYY